MRGTKRSTAAVALLVVLALSVVIMAPMAGAQTAVDGADVPGKVMRPDKRSHPLGDKMAALKAKALEDKVKSNGKGQKPGGVYEVEPGEFVRLELQGTEQVWTVPGEFPDVLHNTIPEPDRAVDNSSLWVEDFSEEYFDTLLYAQGEGVNSMAEYFLEQSSGRYTVDGDCVDWVLVPEDHTYYDDGNADNDTSENVWLFLNDSLDGWYEREIAAGKTPAEIDEYLSRFDEFDRYDWDMDGVFLEPDGYIDHYQSLHAHNGEEDGGGLLGDTAIWSHSWYANYADIGKTGPSPEFLLGGVHIGESSYWIGDYTIQPENGGVGVFTHEFTHDLGAPDLYDYYGENGTGFWTLMSSGSWLSDNDYDLGSAPNHEDAWIKLQLGWLNYVVATPGATGKITLGPAEYNSTKAQAVLVNLPDKYVEWTIAEPYAGEKFYYSGQGDNLHNKMYKAMTLPAGAQLTAKVNYGIEEGYDYASLIVSKDGGTTWDIVATNLSNSKVADGAIDGFSEGWVDLSADLSDYAGDVLLGFAYDSDVGVAEVGFMIDELAITGFAVDGAEADAGWTFVGYGVTTGSESGSYWNYYLAEYRQYWGYDVALANCYNFGYLQGKDAMPNWTDRFPYQDGLLVWYCDTSAPDNNTANHPGSGIALPIDAHPDALTRGGSKNKSTSLLWRNRIQTYDATFGLEPTDALELAYNSKLWKIPSLPGNPVFDDMLDYYNEALPLNSANHPNSGTVIKVLGTAEAADGGSYMGIEVTAPLIP